MPTPHPRLAVVYATDEAIAIRDISAYTALCPISQSVASAADGIFSSGFPWDLSSASKAFQSLGVKANHVIRLTGPKAQYLGSGQLLAIESASGSSVTLRRLGQDIGVGEPPAPAVGLTGVTFQILTYDAQIQVASKDLNRTYSIDPNSALNGPSGLTDTEDLEQACVLKVLIARLLAETQQRDQTWGLKLQNYRQELADVMTRLQLRWGPNNDSTEPQVYDNFSTRLTR